MCFLALLYIVEIQLFFLLVVSVTEKITGIVTTPFTAPIKQSQIVTNLIKQHGGGVVEIIY